jgi:hypothetical protein
MQAFIYQKTKRRQRPKKHLQMMPIRVYELEEADDEFLADDDELMNTDEPVETLIMFFVIFQVEGPSSPSDPPTSPA